MKIIYINSPKYGIKEVFVDDEDYDYLMQWKWVLLKSESKTNTYARRKTRTVNGKQEESLMHRAILKVTDKSTFIDHRDLNGLNNQKSNLRICTKAQNCSNTRSRKGSKSKYLGVYWKGANKKWCASLTKGGEKIYIGVFVNEDDAARAYDVKAKEMHGEFANLNFKEGHKS